VRRILALAAIAVVAFWGGCALWRGFADDETKIRWMLDDAVASFNAGRPRSAVAPFSADWYDRTTGIHKDTLQNALTAMAWQERGNSSGPPWNLVLAEDSLAIDVFDGRAQATFELVLSQRRGETWSEQWHLAIDADLADGDDGWEIVESSHRTLEGRRP
jgi:hypothetical protein